ncbi:MAG: cysteine--tRNA ligase [Phycisphaerae bacterium]|nr:cysteine--tRNA ligase [Phycisphaerae bacterium]
MALRLYNTLSREKEIFEPVEPGKVGIYVCGPTVYKDSHIGHAVGPVIFDALKKYLTFKGYQVKLVINITDVDDKLIIESKARHISMDELAQEVSAGYFESMDKLGVNSIDLYPRATEHIKEIIDMIQKLGENNAAYAVDGDVYCDISECKDYGKLSHRRSEDQKDGSRELAGSEKRNAGDFALWKKAEEGEIGWESPWGYGRPGWHIECSAMSTKYLGETFDIHGGGLDLIFPHHENEIAQSETATGKPFANYWLHNGLTRMKTKSASGEWQDEKMSKSLGNIQPLKEILETYPPQCIRFFLLSTHYRRPIDFSEESIEASKKGLMNIYRTLERLERLDGDSDLFTTEGNVKKMSEKINGDADQALFDAVAQGHLRYLESLDDDFNTAGAIAVLHDLSSAINRYIDKQQLERQGGEHGRMMAIESGRMLTWLGQVIGLLEGPLEKQEGGDALAGQLMEVFIALRAEARKEKNFALADAIRDKLTALKIVIEDRPDGAIWRKEQ